MSDHACMIRRTRLEIDSNAISVHNCALLCLSM